MSKVFVVRRLARALWLAAVCTCLQGVSLAAGLEEAAPEACGMDPARLQEIDALVAQGLAEKKMPGCVVCVGRHGKVVWLKAYGDKQITPTTVPMTTDTVFDMASITKPVATATSVMLLVERGQLKLTDKVSQYFPGFEQNDKGEITIQHLLTHTSGLLPDNALADYQHGHDEAFARICKLKLQAPTGSRFIYSDVNFILLGELVHKVSGRPLDQFVKEEVYSPLGMRESGYKPGPELSARAAVTQERNGKWMQGEVHDPRAYALDGVAGHAGLFSTARDLAIYAQMMINGGEYNGTRVFQTATLEEMTKKHRVPRGVRGLGWDKRTGFSSNKGDLLSDAAVGHGGFTGTVLWIDPELDLFFIFLSNRVHPDGKGSVNQLAGRIATVAASAIRDQPPAAAASGALTGIDVLERDQFQQLAGRKVGLITNHTGRNQHGKSTVELLHQAPNVELVALFSPEHGFEGKLDRDGIGNTRDSATGLLVYSLYGETRKPTPEMLSQLDTLVFDIQDVGCRFYTYTSTMGEAMKACAAHGKRFVLLDRPNPINGNAVAGPMLDAGQESFVGFHSMPVQHGMTQGELALMFKEELKLDLDLQVIECSGWKRADYWDATGLTWINPSPNMRSLTEAILYPGVGLLEFTNVSVGRGTNTPFEVIGAPWMDGRKLAAELNSRKIPGVVFIPIEFTPDSSKFEKEKCQGINIQITDREKFESVRMGLEIAIALRQLFPETWDSKRYMRLLSNQKTFDAVVAGESAGKVHEIAAEGVEEFLRRRREFLLY